MKKPKRFVVTIAEGEEAPSSFGDGCTYTIALLLGVFATLAACSGIMKWLSH